MISIPICPSEQPQLHAKVSRNTSKKSSKRIIKKEKKRIQKCKRKKKETKRLIIFLREFYTYQVPVAQKNLSITYLKYYLNIAYEPIKYFNLMFSCCVKYVNKSLT